MTTATPSEAKARTAAAQAYLQAQRAKSTLALVADVVDLSDAYGPNGEPLGDVVAATLKGGAPRPSALPGFELAPGLADVGFAVDLLERYALREEGPGGAVSAEEAMAALEVVRGTLTVQGSRLSRALARVEALEEAEAKRTTRKGRV